ncbi:MAG: hypothetical protein HeimAB125_05870 [Candidatus Heimdallarchaeota archaeon AB_125]|nr:MAG: hypothetical protein HeimAB125_05870 [Candidatus Heimdallarchaeota archaeon AB_125]
MEKISFKQFMQKSGQMLDKYRSNIAHLTKSRYQLEQQFINPEEMVEYFYSNKSEYYPWQEMQDTITQLEEAYNELIGNLMDAMAQPEAFEFYLKDQRIPVLIMPETNEEDSEGEELLDESMIDELAETIAGDIVDEIEKQE